MALRSALINVMTGAARKAARALVHDFGEVEQLQVSKKGPADFVSAADKRSEQILIKELMSARPRYGALFEESGAIEGADSSNRWIVHPLDGTLNFLHGIPHFCLTIALERDGEIFAGVTYDPLRDEMFWAEKGAGAYLNHSRLRVSSRDRLENAVVATGLPPQRRQNHSGLSRELDALTPLTAGIRHLGSAALDLAYVAAGRFDGFWEKGLHPWDVAAGIILIREAGGFVGEIDGGDDFLNNGSIIGANDRLYDGIAKTLRSATYAAE
tara:strand:- start:26433 stop:27239 length:807 start_codon:yes stop_codon:yes gene_type:complete